MQTEDMNLNNTEEIDLIEELDDVESFDEEGGVLSDEEMGHTQAATAIDEQDEAAAKDENAKHALNIIRADVREGNVHAKSSINDLPILVTAQIGMFSMSLNDFENLNEGDLIQVSPDYQNRVSLQVSGSEIGVGEVVSINGDIAIQITRLWG